MGIHAKLINHDEMFYNNSGPNSTILNDVIDVTEDQKDTINKVLYTTNGDYYTNIPSCSCGKLKGSHRIGQLCSNCNTEIREVVEQFLIPHVFIRTPRDVSKLVNPKIWMLLRQKLQFSKGKFDLVKYLTDPYYNPEIKNTENIQSVLNKLTSEGLNIRNYNNFIDNFYTYIDFLLDLKEFKGKVKGPRPDLYYLIQENKDNIFSDYIPLINKALLVVEKTNVGSYIDQQLPILLDAARLMIGIDTEEKANIKSLGRQSRTSKCLSLLSDFYLNTYSSFLSPKTALLRRHIGGTRVDYSFRTVITSNSGPHEYDEIHIPWSVAISVLKVHIENKLLKRGFCPNQIAHFLTMYALEYNEVLDDIFKELINEAKKGNRHGIPCLINRNPSLLKGSIMRCRITKVKTDTSDVTTSLPVLITGNLNADFDGDEMNFMLLLDNYSDSRAHMMAPEMNSYNLNSTTKASDVLNVTKQVSSSTQIWLNDDEYEDPLIKEKMARFQ